MYDTSFREAVTLDTHVLIQEQFGSLTVLFEDKSEQDQTNAALNIIEHVIRQVPDAIDKIEKLVHDIHEMGGPAP